MVSGYVHALHSTAADEALARSGLFPMRVREDPPARVGRSHSARDLAVGFRLLGELLTSGVVVSQALSAMKDLGPRIWQESAADIADMIEEGVPLSEAMSATRLRVPPYIVAIVQAGETSGTLGESMRVAAATLEESVAVRKAIINTLTYPAVLVVTGLATLLLLMTVVLPRLTRAFEDIGQEMPFLAMAALRTTSVVPTGIKLIAILMLVVVLTNAFRGRPLLPGYSVLLAMPLVRPIRACFLSNRVTALLGNLLASGVHLPVALSATADATDDMSLKERLRAVQTRVLSGEALSASLEAEQALTPVALRFVRVGEQTGRLAEMIHQASRIDALEANERLVKLLRVLEPTLIASIGLIVLLIALMLTQVMYGLRIG